MKIYDAFTFLNEIDLLEIRLHELNDIVDYFVISEGDRTFSGEEKEYNLEKYKNKFSKFSDKIIYLKSDVSGIAGSNPWRKEEYQRNFLTKSEIGVDSDDIMIISDLDEIPSKQQLKQGIEATLREKAPVTLFFDLYFYYLNNKCVNDPLWLGSVVSKRKYFNHAQMLRENRKDYPRILNDKNPGWHFSYCSNINQIMEKIKSYSHFRDYSNITKEDIYTFIEQGRSFIENDQRFFAKNSKYLPRYVFKNVMKFKDILLHKERRFFGYKTISL